MKRVAFFRTLYLVLVSSLLSLSGGCIVSDEVATITVAPDGSADFVRLQSNVHSSLSGDEAAAELRRYVDEFEAQRSDEHARIKDAGGKIRESRWVREEKPYANIIAGTFPTAASLEKAFTFKGDNGEPLAAAHFRQDGTKRRFSVEVSLPREQVAENTVEKTAEELRASQAAGLAETRFALKAGKFTAARGFTIAADKQSALLEPKAILELLKTDRKVEAFIEWDLVE